MRGASSGSFFGDIMRRPSGRGAGTPRKGGLQGPGAFPGRPLLGLLPDFCGPTLRERVIKRLARLAFAE